MTSPGQFPFAIGVLLAGLGLSSCGDDAGAMPTGGSGPGGTGTGGSGGAGTGGAGGGGSSCGDGVVDAGEACDEGGESSSCDADCTAVSCGDGQHNPTAGEGCDDNNLAEGDACSALCQPTQLYLESDISTDVTVAVAWTGDAFSLVWTGGTSDAVFRYARLDAAGISQETDIGGGVAGSFVTMGNNDAGRGMVLDGTFVASELHLSWRFVPPGGPIASSPAGTQNLGATWFLPAGIPNGKVYGTSLGTFCAMSTGGEVRCTDGNDALQPAAFVSGADGILSSHILRVGDGLVASYVTDGPSINESEFRVVALSPSGQQQSDELPLALVDANAYATGGVLRPDGTFGVALSVPGGVTWYPFHATGELDATNVEAIGTPNALRAKLASVPSGRFLLAWYEYEAASTCSIVARLFDESVAPLGDPFVVFQAPNGVCGARFDVASSPDGDVAFAWMNNHQSGGYSARALYLPKLLAP